MKLAVRLALPAVVVATLAGCSPAPSTAVVVDGVTITESQVRTTTQACRAVDPDVTEVSVVQTLTLREVAFKGYEKLGIPVEETKLDEAISQNPAVAAVAGTPCWKVAQGVFLFNSIRSIQDQSRIEVFAQVPVELNPRYGSFDLMKGWDTAAGSLSVLSEK